VRKRGSSHFSRSTGGIDSPQSQYPHPNTCNEMRSVNLLIS
jgi:hypothetical protein